MGMVETNFGMRYAPHRSGGWWQPVDCKLSPAQLDQLLDNPSTDLLTTAGPGEAYTVWADEAAEEITFVYRGWHNQSVGSDELDTAGDNYTQPSRPWAEVRLSVGLQIPLRPVPDRPDLWELTLHIKGLAQGVISYEFMPLEEPLTAYTAATAFQRYHQRQQARQNWRRGQGLGHLQHSKAQQPPAQAAPASGSGNSTTNPAPAPATATPTATQHDAVIPSLPPVQQWRGSHSPAVPIKSALSHLQGKLKTYDLPSFVLGELRTLTVYTPPPALSTALPPHLLAKSEGDDDSYNSRSAPTHVSVPASPLPVVYLADGVGVAGYACVIEPLILAGQLPPVVLVGLHSGDSLRGNPSTTANTTTNLTLDRRAAEYLPGHTAGPFFDDHARFFVEEVLPWSVNTLGVSDRRENRAVFGVSNGAAWAIEMGNRYPDLFSAVIAFSLGWHRGFSDSWLGEVAGTRPALQTNTNTPAIEFAPAPGEVEQTQPRPQPRSRYYLEAGTLEDGFRDTTAQWASRLAEAGVECEHRQLVASHDYVVWQEEFGRSVQWVFGQGAVNKD